MCYPVGILKWTFFGHDNNKIGGLQIAQNTQVFDGMWMPSNKERIRILKNL